MISRKLAASLLVLVAALSATSHAHAQPMQAVAVALFDEGRAALQRGDFDIACAKFKESNRIGPAVGTAFNLANCEEKRGRLATAWVLFKQVATQMKPDDPRLSVAIERVASLEKRIPRVVFAANKGTPAETRVRIDDLELGNASFGSAIPVDPGEHRAVIRSPRVEPRTLAFTLAEGETTTLDLTPPSTQQPATHSSRPPAAADALPRNDRILGLERPKALLLAGGVGAAGLAVGIVTGLVGLHDQALGDAACSSVTRTCSRRGHDANQRAKDMAVVSSTGFALAILAAGAVGYLYFTAPSSHSEASLGVGGRW